jgi:hypothetical protein
MSEGKFKPFDLVKASCGVETSVAPWPNGPIRLLLLSIIGSEMLDATLVEEVFEDNKEDLESQDEIEGRVRWLLEII